MAWTNYYLDLSAGSNGDGLGTGTPWDSIANMVSGLTTIFGGTTATHSAIVNVKGTRANTSSTVTMSISGTAAFWFWLRGCDSSWVALDDNPTGTRPQIGFTTGRFELTGSRVLMSCIEVTGASTSTAQLYITGATPWLHRVRAVTTSTTVICLRTTSAATDALLTDCQVAAPITSAQDALYMLGSRSRALGCSTRGGAVGIELAAGSSCAIGCTVFDPVNAGIQAINGDFLILNNSIYGAGTDAIRTTVAANLGVIRNNLSASSTGYDINSSAASSNSVRITGGAYYSAGSGGLGGIIEDHAFGRLAALGSSPFTNAAGNDFSPATGAARAAALPGRFEGETFTSYRDLGAVQHQDSGGGSYAAAADVLFGVDRGDGTTGTYVTVATGDVKTGVTYGAASALTGTYTGSDRWTDPGVANVLLSVAYKADSTTNNRTGTVTLPDAADVESGVTFGPSLGLTGTLVVGGGGSYTDPGIANVKTGVGYTYNSVSLTGTYTGSDRWTDPGIANVRAATAYKADSTTNNRTGTCAVPAAADVEFGVSVDATTGTFVVPTEDQVEIGVDYGASAEFTGTLSGGGGSSDWTSTEKAQIRYRLGIDGTQTEPTTAAATLLNDSPLSNSDGTLASATSTTAVLDASAPTPADSSLVGWRVTIRSSGGLLRSRIVTANTGKTLTVASWGSPTPDNTFTYTLDPAESYNPLIDAAITSRAGATELSAVAATVGGLALGVTVTTNNDKNGYALSPSGVTAAQSGLATQASVTTIDDLLDTEVAAIKSDTAAIKVKTDQLAFTSGNVDAHVMDFDAALDAGDVPTVAEIAAGVRDVNNTTPAASSLGAMVNASASGGLDPGEVADLVVAGLGTVDANVLTLDPAAVTAVWDGMPAGDSLAEIAAAVRDVSNASPSAGSLGEAINDAGAGGGGISADDVWAHSTATAIKARTDLIPDLAATGTVTGSGGTTTTLVGDSGLSSTNDFYNGAVLAFTSGALKGTGGRRITDYAGSTRTFTFAEAFPSAPANGATFVILGRIDPPAEAAP